MQIVDHSDDGGGCVSNDPRRRSLETFTATRAIENTIFLAFVNLLGIEDGLQFWGGSRIIGPGGNLVARAKYDEEDLIATGINCLELTRAQTWVPVLRDLRPEIFELLRREAEDSRSCACDATYHVTSLDHICCRPPDLRGEIIINPLYSPLA